MSGRKQTKKQCIEEETPNTRTTTNKYNANNLQTKISVIFYGSLK